MEKNKDALLEEITKEILACEECKIDRVGVAVVGEGNSNAEVVFIGEAPGRNESVVGRPFIGRSGKLLRKLINDSGLKEEDVYITSPVKYLPVYVTPKPSDIAHGKVHLDKQLQVIEPEYVVLLGSVAVQAVLGRKIAVLKEHGNIVREDNIQYFITVHPAAALRFKKFKSVLEEDFKKLKLLVNM